MTTKRITVIACDKPGCPEQVAARCDESTDDLRRRANRDRGWQSTPSFTRGGHTDTCRWHA